MIIPSSTDSIEPRKSEIKFSDFLFIYKQFIILSVESKGLPHGEESVFDIRIEGFNTPWLHFRNHLKNEVVFDLRY